VLVIVALLLYNKLRVFSGGKNMKYSIIPEPIKMTVGNTDVFTLTRLCEIEYDSGSEKAYKALIKFLSDSFSMELIGTGKEKIILKIDESIKGDEGYTLSVSKDTAVICGKDEAGVFYGVQSLKQLLFQGELTLPEVEIEDCPRFSYRGFMLDCGRYFFTKDAVKVFLEMMALHKLNTFHWHLSEDQGFRAQVLDKLLLTEIGSYRSHTNFNITKHEGYYTVDDMREIVAYAHNLCIKVIPEIDTPGHAVAMIAAYPELSCFDRKLEVATHWGVKHDVLCIGKESTFEFMQTVVDELLETFTDGIFHLGGDEVPTTRWKLCPYCQKRIKDENLKDESALHTYYLDRMADYLKNKGVEVIMWNDAIKDYMVRKDVVWQFWNGDMKKEDIVGEINSGRPFIMSNISAYYLDLPYAHVNLKDTYDFEPVYDGIKEENKHLVKGVEACLWSEFVPTMEKAGYCTYPRLGAFSETAWSPEENKNYDRFLSKLDNYYSILGAYGIDTASLKQALPGTVRKVGNLIWWERRKLCWEGLHNLIDNAQVKRKYGKKEK
jgi:hexosaminidase